MHTTLRSSLIPQYKGCNPLSVPKPKDSEIVHIKITGRGRRAVAAAQTKHARTKEHTNVRTYERLNDAKHILDVNIVYIWQE